MRTSLFERVKGKIREIGLASAVIGGSLVGGCTANGEIDGLALGSIALAGVGAYKGNVAAHTIGSLGADYASSRAGASNVNVIVNSRNDTNSQISFRIFRSCSIFTKESRIPSVSS